MMFPLYVGAQCACACYDPNDLTNCVSGSCGNSNFTNCINAGLTWFQGGGSVPSGMCACEYLILISLSVELKSLDIDCDSIYWETVSESDCDYFLIEGSDNGYVWDYVSDVDCMNSQGGYTYSFLIREGSFSYYRVSELDVDGKSDNLGVVSYNCDGTSLSVEGVYDTMGKYVGDRLPRSGGLFIIRYSDKSVKRVYSPGL